MKSLFWFLLSASLLWKSQLMFSQNQLQKFYQDYQEAQRTHHPTGKNISGSPYEYERFEKGRIWLKGQKNPVITELRYNNYLDEMEFRKPEKTDFFILARKYTIDSIQLNSFTWRYLHYIKNDIENFGFFRVLSHSENKLYLKSKKTFQDEIKPESGYQDYSPACYKKEEDEYYISFSSETLYYIPKRSKKIQEFFLGKGYINKNINKIKYRTPDLDAYIKGLEKFK